MREFSINSLDTDPFRRTTLARDGDFVFKNGKRSIALSLSLSLISFTLFISHFSLTLTLQTLLLLTLFRAFCFEQSFSSKVNMIENSVSAKSGIKLFNFSIVAGVTRRDSSV